MRKRLSLLALVVGLVVAACGSHTTNNVATSKSDTKAANTVSALVTSCVQKVSVFKLVTKGGRKAVVTCLEKDIPPAKRAQFEKCLTDAAVSDKIWKHSGRSKFESVSAANCINQATGK